MVTATETDENQYLFALFERLASEIVAEAASGEPSLDRARRLWRLPTHVVYYYHNVLTDTERVRVRPLVETLRQRAVKFIHALPERAGDRTQLAERIRLAQNQFVFRPWHMDDLDLFISLLDNPAMWAHVSESYPDPLTLELASSLIVVSNEAPLRHEVRAVEWEGQVVGQVRLQFDSSPAPDAAEISYWLAEQYWNRGLTTNFVMLYTYESFRSHPEIDRLFAQVLDGNDPSIRVLEKAGYRQERFEYHNVEIQGQQVSSRMFSVYGTDYRP